MFNRSSTLTAFVCLLTAANSYDAIAAYSPGSEIENSLARSIKRHWLPPKSQESRPVTVNFAIDSAGRLHWVHLLKPSGISFFDEAAIHAVEDAAPFHPLPPGAPPIVVFDFKFDYTVFSEGSPLSIDRFAEQFPLDYNAGSAYPNGETSLGEIFDRGISAARAADFKTASSLFYIVAVNDINNLPAKKNRYLCVYALSTLGVGPMPNWRDDGKVLDPEVRRQLDDLRDYILTHKDDASAKQKFQDLVIGLLANPTGCSVKP